MGQTCRKQPMHLTQNIFNADRQRRRASGIKHQHWFVIRESIAVLVRSPEHRGLGSGVRFGVAGDDESNKLGWWIDAPGGYHRKSARCNGGKETQGARSTARCAVGTGPSPRQLVALLDGLLHSCPSCTVSPLVGGIHDGQIDVPFAAGFLKEMDDSDLAHRGGFIHGLRGAAVGAIPVKEGSTGETLSFFATSSTAPVAAGGA
ncbi:hypothetical protein BDK51DRAFT_51068 [Blyttiomyces helicus]|uniref:Uncharacterized protein n=1 Tax=Blyttiomyces helicus TaxID=388810 RepID=A0A4P9VVJ9_9FUNG|nr:hypothetical protein BDK51DRAFT_51068 [Blyttiomyces helicus]|eukprot:RKO83152.1 hypothetical protein BDK51DRAFT_51068 [Blyttiomyces helicus]